MTHRPTGGIMEQLGRAVGHATKASRDLPSALRAIRDAMEGHPGVQSYDAPRVSGFTSRLYCEAHESDLQDCRAAAKKANEGCSCTGVPMPVATDRVGEAAVEAAMGRDRASNDHRRAKRLVELLERTAAELVDVIDDYRARSANPVEKRKAEQANTRDPGCELCERDGRAWSPPFTAKPTDVSGVLAEPFLLCEWHWRFARKTGRNANPAETRAYVEGRAVKVPA